MEKRGLYGKYRIQKGQTGEEVDGPAFVLRPDRDPAARKALWEYAKASIGTNWELALDITEWLSDICESNDIPKDYEDGYHWPWQWRSLEDYKR